MSLKYFIRILIGCVILCLLNACASGFKPIEITDIPLALPENQNVTMRTILTQTEEQVQQYVPGAYASSLTFLGQYEGLDQALGKINIGYVRVDRRFGLRSRVIVGMLSVDTLTYTMEMRFEDHTKHYPSARAPHILPEDLPLLSVTRLAYSHIDGLGITDCDITLTYLRDVWHVLCTEPGSGPLGARKCAFEIDSVTMQVLEP